jgi:hypothetical protein
MRYRTGIYLRNPELPHSRRSSIFYLSAQTLKVMKRLSYYAPALALAAVLALSGAAPASSATPTISAKADFQVMYYWYLEPDDLPDQYADVDDEENELWILYGGYVVNTIPTGGTLVAEGFLNNNYPHTEFPSVYLYVHFY